MYTNAFVLLGEGIEILLEQNVLGGDVGKNEIDLGPVSIRTPAYNGSDDLQHGRDAGATCNHAKMANHVGRIDESALGATDTDRLTDRHRCHVFGDVALGIGLDQEVKVSGLVIAGDGRIRSDNLLGCAIGLLQIGADRNVLADGKAEDRIGRGELEAIAAGW